MPPPPCWAGRCWRFRFWAWPKRPSRFAAASPAGADRRPCTPEQWIPRTHGVAAMEVILLERVAKLGQMGEVVRVKDGFARNYLLPKGKALRATKENRSRFENMKVELEARNLKEKGEAEKIAKTLNGRSFTVLRQAAEGGQLYGSVSPRDLAALISESGCAISRSQIALNTPIKAVGAHKVPVSLHPEVEVTINVTVARNADEAQRIGPGDNVTRRGEAQQKEGKERPEETRVAREA